MATNEPGRVAGDGEGDIHGPRPAQRHDKAVEPATAALMHNRAKVVPIHLSLLPWLGFKAPGGRGFWQFAMRMNLLAQLGNRQETSKKSDENRRVPDFLCVPQCASGATVYTVARMIFCTLILGTISPLIEA